MCSYTLFVAARAVAELTLLADSKRMDAQHDAAASNVIDAPPQMLPFPAAAQSDIVRAAQKDRLCLGVVESSVQDAVQHLLGPTFLLKHRGSIQALSCALYYGETTGGSPCAVAAFGTACPVSMASESRLLIVLAHSPAIYSWHAHLHVPPVLVTAQLIRFQMSQDAV